MGSRGPVSNQASLAAEGIPQRPGMPDEASAVWDGLVSLLGESRIAGAADAASLERYCRYVVLWRTAVDACEQPGGLVRITEKGVSESPEARLMLRLGQELLKIEQQFGLTPAARSRLAKPEEPPVVDDEGMFGETE